MKTTGAEALDDFKALEERIGRVLEVLGESRKEKQALAARLHEARAEIRQLESRVRELQKERKSVRTRVEDLVRMIAELETANLEARLEARTEQQVV
jgi:chromosome segregation ATPase